MFKKINESEGINQITRKSIKEETFDKDYVGAVQKIEGIEAQKSVREYQRLIAAIKISGKIAFVINCWKLMETISEMGLSEFLFLFGGLI